MISRTLKFLFFLFLSKNIFSQLVEFESNLSSKKINVSIFDSKDLLKKEIKIVNFFATWCGPCKIEHPQLMELSSSFRIYGIAKKDNPQNITKWLKSYGNPFDKIGLDNDGISSIEWGVYGLPETFLINKDNKILYKHIGPIMKNDLEKINAFLK